MAGPEASPDPRRQPFAGTLHVPDLCTRAATVEARQRFVAAVAERYLVDPACVVPTMGASLAIMNTLMAMVRPGDHVVVERPTYEALWRAPEILGARVSRLERTFDAGWQAVPERLAQLLTPRTRVVLLSNLHNPSGVAIDAASLRAVAELAARVGAMVLVDEVYLDWCFDPSDQATVKPACKVAPNCVSWSSTTKAFGFGALRAGWIVAPDPETARAIGLASEFLHVYQPVASLELARRVLDEADVLQAHAQAKAVAGRKVMQRWVESERRVGWVSPDAGITGLVRLPDLVQDGPFVEHLRERYETQVAPGSMFEAPGHVRVSYGLPKGDLEQGLANISAALDDLQG